jgi:hypothetical protein
MNKTHIIGIIIGLTITLSITPAVNTNGGIVIISPTGETYRRGDTLVIEAASYADADALLQIKLGSTVTWADQVVGAFSPNFVYKMIIPSTWSVGTYTVHVKGDTGAVESTTFYLSVPSGGGTYTPASAAKFVLSDFTISPTTVEPDETVKISVKVTNTGTKSGTKTVKLTIDGVVEGSKDVTLGVQESESVSWNVKKTTPGTYSVDVNGLIGSFKVETEEGPEPGPPEPASFILSNLVVSPITVEPDEPVTVSVTVMNVGEEAGSYTAELLVDGSKVDEDTVTLVGGASETVVFTGVSGEEGSHTVSVSNLYGGFTVEMPPGGVGPNWALYTVGGLAILGVAWVVYKRFLES